MAQYFNKTQLITNRSKGFTLIEIMITIAIIGVITAVAWPSYERYQEKGRRADGISALLQNSANLEKCFINHGAYNHARCNVSVPSPSSSTENYYTIAIVRAADTYTITATPKNAQAGDAECATLTVDQLGEKKSTGSATEKRCWSR